METEVTATEPLTHPEKVAAITELLSSEVEQGEGDSAPDGNDVQAQDDGGADSGSGAVDGQESNADESVQDDSEDAAQGSDDTESVTVAKLAERLDIDPADVYDLQVPIGEGEHKSLGELKDSFKEYGPAVEFKEQLDVQKREFEAKELATKNHFNGIMAVIPAEMREQVLEAGRDYQEQWERDQVQATLDAIPEWKDSEKRLSDRQLIVDVGREYGYTEAQIENTRQAGALKLLRDYALARQELETMKAASKKVNKTPNAAGKGRSGTQSKRKLAAALNRAKSSKHIPDKVAAVSQLIRNK